jgi:hypothetical protein
MLLIVASPKLVESKSVVSAGIIINVARNITVACRRGSVHDVRASPPSSS